MLCTYFPQNVTFNCTVFLQLLSRAYQTLQVSKKIGLLVMSTPQRVVLNQGLKRGWPRVGASQFLELPKQVLFSAVLCLLKKPFKGQRPSYWEEQKRKDSLMRGHWYLYLCGPNTDIWLLAPSLFKYTNLKITQKLRGPPPLYSSLLHIPISSFFLEKNAYQCPIKFACLHLLPFQEYKTFPPKINTHFKNYSRTITFSLILWQSYTPNFMGWGRASLVISYILEAWVL